MDFFIGRIRGAGLSIKVNKKERRLSLLSIKIIPNKNISGKFVQDYSTVKEMVLVGFSLPFK